MPKRDVPSNVVSVNQLTPVLTRDADGKPRADSRDVAAKFGKRHSDVLRAIDDLLSQEPRTERNFALSSYTSGLEGNNRQYRCVTMDRDGFTLLAMGFTGSEALKWKLAYIQAFNAMEAELLERLPQDPDERTLYFAEAFIASNKAKKKLEQELVETQVVLKQTDNRLEKVKEILHDIAPDAIAYRNYADADGMFTLQNAGRIITGRPNRFIKWLDANGYIFTQDGKRVPIARYNNKLFATKMVARRNDPSKMEIQTFITKDGLDHFMKIRDAGSVSELLFDFNGNDEQEERYGS